MSKTDTFPFKTVLTLSHLVDFWRKIGADEATPSAVVARHIQQQIDETPVLAEPITDLAFMDEYRDLLDLMMVAVFPPALWTGSMMAVTPPFQLQPFYSTPHFDRLRLFTNGLPENLDVDECDEAGMQATRTMHAYFWILSCFYEVEKPKGLPIVFRLTDADTQLDRYFKLDINMRFASIEPKGDLPDLSNDQIQHLLSAPTDLTRWTRLLPPDLFEFHGFMVMTATEVTDQAVISALKADLLQKNAMASPDQVDRLQRRLRALLRQPDLELGLICLQRDDIDGITGARSIGKSLLLDETGAPDCPHKAESLYARAYERDDALVVTDLHECAVCTGYEQHLKNKGIRTLLLAPLRYEGKLIGLLELGSATPNAISTLTSLTIGEAVSLFATAMKRMLDEQEDRIQSAIKEHYTAIHPAVEWRFREAAQRFLQKQEMDRTAQIEPIVFHDVSPLYGLTDIRSSSENRSEAIQADLVVQLGMAYSIVVEASIAKPLPILDELSFRIGQYADRIKPGASSEDETNVLEFLRNEVEPRFDRLATFGKRVEARIQAYRDALDPDLGVVFQQRKDYEESVTHINDAVSAYLDVQEAHAQAMFPHYFEKFQTDGVDYNIYVGAAIIQNGVFDPLYLHNMRLWQLMTMCGIEWELKKLKPTLKMPLDATHLILVQSVPLSIRFRMEEKQFDVDGAYNIRYEIIKKRIDKAVIKGTGERLTQPGKIAIVYSQTREAEEYQHYLAYLQAAGYVTGEIEEFELEAMQGAHGLRAIRFTVSDAAPESEIEIETELVRAAAKGTETVSA